MAERIIVAYIPVIHRGYIRLFDNYPDLKTLYVLDNDIVHSYRHLQKDVRALSPQETARVLDGLERFDTVKVVDSVMLSSIVGNDVELVMPDDEISHDLAGTVLAGVSIEFSPIFLRWDRRKSMLQQEVDAERVSLNDMQREFMRESYATGLKSTNIWRRVGAVLVKEGRVVAYSSNRQRPSEYSSWIDGDVRSNFGKGVGIEMSTDQHAESCVIADAARRGIALEGADLYVTTFPCPPCSMLIAYSGIRKLYYAEGYAVLDGERILRDNGVELYKVDVPAIDDERVYVEYPES